MEKKLKKPVLYIKFGMIKGGDYKDSPEALELSDKLNSIDDIKIRECVELRIIDLFNGKIHEWWSGKFVSKKQAKIYITTYETVKSTID